MEAFDEKTGRYDNTLFEYDALQSLNYLDVLQTQTIDMHSFAGLALLRRRRESANSSSR